MGEGGGCGAFEADKVREELRQLRAAVKKQQPPTRCAVHRLEPVNLPPAVEEVLSLGPKFAVEPKRSAPELLSLVHHVSRQAPEEEQDRCISEGVDVLSRCKPAPSKLPDAVISKLECQAKKLCKKLNLVKVIDGISKSKKDFLDLFFSAKTHKPEKPFRVIVSERSTWQNSIALFLQEKLGLLRFNDPFLVRNSEEILDFLQSEPPKGLCAFSLDIKDLYYSLPQDKLLYFIEEYIDEFGSVAFQNAAGVSVSGFLELLSFYLRSTYIEYDGKPCLQREGTCIGSCIAPILSDLFLSKLDNGVAGFFDKMKISVAESLLKKIRAATREEPITATNSRPKFAVIPYLHGVSHNLKKIGGRANIKVVFSAPDKLTKLCKASNPFRKPPLQCAKKHDTKYVKCVGNVVYEIPLSCGKRYIGQTGRCLNDRLREHCANVRNGSSGWLAHHCSMCEWEGGKQ
ncbi:uncharacterized protein LOC144179781 [Haemaphysalis longicornis]